MKVLYISNYRDGTGWANAAVNNILALHSAGVDVVPRAITYNNSYKTNNNTIANLELKSEAGCDVCIQHTLPHLYTYNADLKNIGFFVTETQTFTETSWQRHINLMDEVWVPNKQMVDACNRSQVKVPVRIAPHSLDMSEYKEAEDCADVAELTGCFNFCFVGEAIERKNIESLVRAFHTEFHPSEPVNLFMKVNKPGYGNDQTVAYMSNFCSGIKARLKIRQNYRDEVVVAGFLEPRHLKSLISKCHCFVMPSFGEAWCIPALESMAIGLPVIYTGGTGMDDFCHGWKVPSRAVPCYGAMNSLSNMYTSRTKWMEPDIQSLGSMMRVAYETYKNSPDKYKAIQQEAVLKAAEYDTKVVGKILRGLLEDE